MDSATAERKLDAVIVGARCAGSTLALLLKKQGWDVAMIDRAEFPSDTLSTHVIFPNTVARLAQLGVLDRLYANHEVPSLDYRIIGYDHESKGSFTPIDGFDQLIAPRRIALDNAFVQTALAAGVEGRFGERAVGLIGSGREDDPVRGVVLDGGEEVQAKWVFGADGRASKVAGKLGIEQAEEMTGEIAFLLAYWRGLSADPNATLDIREDGMLSRWAVEDGMHLLTASGDAEFTKGSKDVLLERYLSALKKFPNTLDPAELEGAEMVGDLLVAPESLMRGYYRQPTGPGWALVGDSCHFKHPGTAQGISDAIEQAHYIAEGVSGDDPDLAGYETWLRKRSAEHYGWSFAWGSFPTSEAPFKGWASEPDAGQDLRDSFTRRLEPSQVLTPERLGRWFA